MAGGKRDRRPAQDRSGKRAPPSETVVRAEQERAAEAAKTARLRALRLAKESADRDAARNAAPSPHRDGATRPRRANAAG